MAETADVLLRTNSSTHAPEVIETAIIIPEQSEHEVIETAIILPEQSENEVIETAIVLPEQSEHKVIETAIVLPEQSEHEFIETAIVLPEQSEHEVIETAIVLPEQSEHEVIETAIILPEQSEHEVIETAIILPEQSEHKVIETAIVLPEQSEHEVIETAILLPEQSEHDESCNAISNDGIEDKQSDSSSILTNRRGVWEYVKGLTADSTLHGLPNITSTATHAWVKVFWSLFMAAGFVLVVWQSIGIFTEYFSYPVSTLFEIHHGELTYPQVTICNHHGFLKSKVQKHPVLSKHPYFINNDSFMSSELIEAINALPINERVSLSYDNITDFIKWSDDFRILSTQSKTPYSLYPSTTVGNCYTLYPKPLEENFQGVDIYVNMHSDEYIERDADRAVWLFFREVGVNPVSYTDFYFDLEPGHQVEADLSLEIIHRLSGKYSHCQDDEDGFYQTTGLKYTQDRCRLIHLNNILIAKCGCVASKMYTKNKINEAYRNFSPCAGNTTDCLFKQIQTIKYKEFPCKPRCHMKRYIVSKTKTALSNANKRWLCMYWRDTCTDYVGSDKWVMSNAALIKLRFPDAHHKEIKQIPSYPLSRFLSDLGGTVGLYLGASLLTLCELPQLIVGVFLHLVDQRTARSEN